VGDIVAAPKRFFPLSGAISSSLALVGGHDYTLLCLLPSTSFLECVLSLLNLAHVASRTLLHV